MRFGHPHSQTEGVMAATWVDLKQIKADVGIEQVFRALRCEAMPIPMHTSSRSRDSFAVNLARNVWSCRSQSC